MPKATDYAEAAVTAARYLPLSTLLSHVLIAFTIEFDNEFERQMPHRTTDHGPSVIGDRPWLVSQVMWANFMRFVRQEGVRVHELQCLAHATREGTQIVLAGMQRWGYVVVETDPADSRPSSASRIVRPTLAGRKAQKVWRPLPGKIEQRWRTRCDKDEIDKLRDALSALVSRFDVELPEYLPLVRYGMFADLPPQKERRSEPYRASGHDLSALLSQALLTFTIDFERESAVSLAISANALRILGDEAVRFRDLPRLSCVSKEAISVSIGFLERAGYVVVEPDASASRGKVARLTRKGRQAQDAYRQLLGGIENRWRVQFGPDTIGNLREALVALMGTPDAESSLLSRALEPPPGGWRASVPKPDGLPHHPMVLHRGGFPDGS